MFRLVLAAVVLAASVASAGEPLRVYKLQAGYYAVQGQNIVAVQIVTPDDPQPPPIPDEMSDNAKAIKATAEKATSDPNREATAVELAAVYRELAAAVRSGKIKDTTPGKEVLAFGVKYATDSLLNPKGAKAKAAWEPMRTEFGNQFAKLVQDGAAAESYAVLLDDAAIGLVASAPNEQPQIDIATIMLIIQMVLEILSKIWPSAVVL